MSSRAVPGAESSACSHRRTLASAEDRRAPTTRAGTARLNISSNADLQRYGAFLAKRYTRRNIIWILGGDYNPPNPAKQWNIATGILSVDPKALVTGHGSRNTESYKVWNGQPGWNLNNIYVDLDGIAQPASATAYARSGPIPFFLIEGAYGGAQTDGTCRLRVYQSILSGACGHCFGYFPIWGFGEPHVNGGIGPARALQTSLDTPAIRQMGHLRRLFLAYAWWKLVPRTDSSLVTTALGSGTSRICPALASDRSFALVWTIGSNFTLNMSALATRNIRCRWFDPVQGAFTAVSDSPFANTGVRAFSPPGERVLVLDAASGALRVSTKPLLQHHRNPDHFTVVTRVVVEMATEQCVDKILPQNVAINQTANRVLGETPSTLRY